MNAPLRRVAVACLLLFGLLLVNVNYLQVVRASSLRDDPRNSRTLLSQFQRERGPILLGTGGGGASPLAVDKPTPQERF
ncbi:MAG: pbpA, partial [Frankiales bacterium]|nr:pbpA [Frankiales bacterium]